MIIKNNKELKQKDFINEFELQKYFENNLFEILGYEFIQTEFSAGNFRIDTLAFDKETNSFKIIEYKNLKNHSLVDQGYTYLKLLLERKADFVLKYNEKKNTNLRISDIDWTQSRIIFVSPIYTEYQLNATSFKNIPIDLVKVTKYEEEILEVDFIKKISNVRIEDLEKHFEEPIVNKEIIVYTEEDHLKSLPNKIKNIYEELKERVLLLDDLDIDVKKVYIAFKGKTNIIDVEFTNNKLNVYINIKKGVLKDPLNIAKDITSIGHHGNGDYKIELYNIEQIDEIMPIIKQSININKK